MSRDKAMGIIITEKLSHYNYYNDRDMQPREVGIREQANKWSVYTSDEKANPVSEKVFDSEDDALENFIKRLRAINKLLDKDG